MNNPIVIDVMMRISFVLHVVAASANFSVGATGVALASVAASAVLLMLIIPRREDV